MFENEKLHSLPVAVEQVTGQRPHPSTLHRWRLRGIAGVKLETVRCGGRRLCSTGAVSRFLSGVTNATDGNPGQVRTPHQRKRDIDRAEAELAEAGI